MDRSVSHGATTAAVAVEFRLIGASLSGRSTAIRAGRTSQVLAVLAIDGDWVPRGRLCTMLWPDHDGAAARRNLRYLIHRLLADGLVPPLEQTGDLIRWSVPTDLQRFDRACTEGEWTKAAMLSAGELLPGLERGSSTDYRTWLSLERTRFSSRRRLALANALSDRTATPALRHELALAHLHAPTTEPALDEIRASIGSGPEGALSPDALLQRVVAALRAAEFEPMSGQTRRVATPDSMSHGLEEPMPTKATPAPSNKAWLVGRDAELQSLRQLMSLPQCRWVSLTGPGGIGKTALARAWHHERQDQPMQSIHWVDCEQERFVDGLALRVAEAMHLDVDLQNPLQQLVQRVGRAEVTLILDGTEQVHKLEQAMDAFQQACPHLRVLSTSRHVLGHQGETVIALTGLRLPEPHVNDLSALRSCPSVMLFAQGAMRARPGFDLRAHADAVIDLVRLLEGNPLAIRWMANWVRYLPVRDLCESIAGGAASLRTLADHRSSPALQTSFDRSWALLSPAERSALAALSIYGADFDPVGAAQVADTTPMVIEALRDKSLLHIDERGRGSLHGLVRGYAIEHCATPDVVRERHARHYERLFADLQDWDSVQLQRAARNLDAEWDNGLAAARWAASRSHTLLESLLWPLRELANSAVRRDAIGTLMRETAAAHAGADDVPPSVTVALARNRLELSLTGGQDAELHDGLCAQLCDAARRARSRVGIAHGLIFRSWTLALRGEFARALPLGLRGLRAARRYGLASLQGKALEVLARGAALAGRTAQADAFLDELDRHMRLMGEAPVSRINAWHTAATLHLQSWRLEEAQAAYGAILSIVDQYHIDQEVEPFTLLRAQLDLLLGRVEAGRAGLAEVRRRVAVPRVRFSAVTAALCDVHLALLQAQWSVARAQLGALLRELLAFGELDAYRWRILLLHATWLRGMSAVRRSVALAARVAEHGGTPAFYKRWARELLTLWGIDMAVPVSPTVTAEALGGTLGWMLVDLEDASRPTDLT